MRINTILRIVYSQRGIRFVSFPCIPVRVEIITNNMDYTTQDIINLIEVQAIVAQVNPQTALRIAMCESSLDPKAKNSISSARGLYQFTDTTWQWIKAPMTQEDTYWSVVMFMKYYPTHGSWWECK